MVHVHPQPIRSAVLSLSLLASAAWVAPACTVDARPVESTRAGAAALASNGDAGFALSTSATGSEDAFPSLSYNSSGGTNHITHLGTGQYEVDFPGLGNTIGGDVQVNAAEWAARCKVAGWGSAGSTLAVYVNCYDFSGNPKDNGFTVDYVRRDDQPGPEGAYLWSYDSSSASYAPSTDYQWNSSGGAISVTHTPGTGTYLVSLDGQNLRAGTVEVTAYGWTNSYCKVVGWGDPGVTVACFDGATGQPTESTFDLVFSTKSPNNTMSYTYAWNYAPTSAGFTVGGSFQTGFIFACTDGNGNPIGLTPAPAAISRVSTGTYWVNFPSQAPSLGTPVNALATAYGSGSESCVADASVILGDSLSINGSDIRILVKCYDTTGAPADSSFTITYSGFAFGIC